MSSKSSGTKDGEENGNNDSLEESKKLENDLQTTVDPEEEIPDGIASDNLLGDLLIKEDDNFDEDVSDSDGYLSEDPECPYISEVEGESCSEEKCTDVVLLEQNKEMNQRLNSWKRKLSKLCDKYSDDEGDTCSIDDEDLIEDEISQVSKVITSSTVDAWCWLAMEQPNSSALANLLNAFRAACHYGLETGEVSPLNIANGEVFSKSLTFVLSEAEGIFCRLLRFSAQIINPTIFCFPIPNKETDQGMSNVLLAKASGQLNVFHWEKFDILQKRKRKISIHLWVTGDKDMSRSSFLILQDIASEFSLDNLDTCLTKAFVAFIKTSKFMESQNIEY
ncbi:hypothetical protein ZIOFF_007476 [Zingiber officinale]|uniref:Uncharacterized protein n=1 Tax=Zingiber officinale TaxID=94328 RepID=A0A8J5I4Y9_ZINOF|nr:hypothetical protein ZIOFF_007476 [Zingiber officinale]